MFKIVWKYIFRKSLDLYIKLSIHIRVVRRRKSKNGSMHIYSTFRMTIVSPLGPQPQQSEYSGLLNISNVFVKKPGTDAIFL